MFLLFFYFSTFFSSSFSQVPIIGQRRPCRINWISRSTLAFGRPHCCWWRRNADVIRWYGSHCIWTDVLCAAKRIGMIISKCRKFHRRTHSYSKWVVDAKPYLTQLHRHSTPSISPSHFPFIVSSCLGSCSRSRFCPLCPSCLLCFCHFQHPVRFVSFQLGLIWFRWVCLGLPGLSSPIRPFACWLGVCASSLGFWIRAFAFWLHTGNVWASLVLRCRLAFYKFQFLPQAIESQFPVYVCAASRWSHEVNRAATGQLTRGIGNQLEKWIKKGAGANNVAFLMKELKRYICFAAVCREFSYSASMLHTHRHTNTTSMLHLQSSCMFL